MARTLRERTAAWRALMTTACASDYLSLGEKSFRWLAHQRGVKPVDCGGLRVERWRRTCLDRMVECLPPRDGENPAQEALDGSCARPLPDGADPAADALARAARRVRRAGAGP